MWQPSQKCVLPQQYHDATEQQKRHLCSMNALPCFWHELASDDSDEQLPQICAQPPRDTTSQPSAAQNEQELSETWTDGRMTRWLRKRAVWPFRHSKTLAGQARRANVALAVRA